MAWVIFGIYKQKLFTQVDAIDFDDNSTTTVKLALVTSTFTPAIDTQDFWDDLVANEVSGTNYTAGGLSITNRSASAPSSGVVTLDADDPATISQDAAGFTDARYAILYKATGTNSTSPLIAYYDLTSDRGNVDGDLSFTLDASGIMTVS